MMNGAGAFGEQTDRIVIAVGCKRPVKTGPQGIAKAIAERMDVLVSMVPKQCIFPVHLAIVLGHQRAMGC
jgi:hypothetical protein